MENSSGFTIASVVDTNNYTITVSDTATVGSIRGGGKIASARSCYIGGLMSFTLTTLKSTIQDYSENTETTFVNNLREFIKASREQNI